MFCTKPTAIRTDASATDCFVTPSPRNVKKWLDAAAD